MLNKKMQVNLPQQNQQFTLEMLIEKYRAYQQKANTPSQPAYDEGRQALRGILLGTLRQGFLPQNVLADEELRFSSDRTSY